MMTMAWTLVQLTYLITLMVYGQRKRNSSQKMAEQATSSVTPSGLIATQLLSALGTEVLVLCISSIRVGAGGCRQPNLGRVMENKGIASALLLIRLIVVRS
jgi:hypothetical protein